MRLDVMTAGSGLRWIQDLARDVDAAGLDGIVVTETGRTAYLSCAAAALAAEIDILTGIAVAFPRSPMLTAQIAWELAEASGGRFRLGLGAQVRAHIERRYGSPFDPPGPASASTRKPCAPASAPSVDRSGWRSTASGGSCRSSHRNGAPVPSTCPTPPSMWRR